MTFVVTDACIRCKYMDCIEVCPTDSFREGANMLVIDPDNCIDCAICVPECPANAILPDTDVGASQWIGINATHAASWPEITRKRDSPVDADAWRGVPDKFARHFSGKAGEGD
ncbi:ferredoxin family protein [Sphingomonas populi]|uniref:Ferredoxin n=1 Tax=Sphingomonas populi TaxID=2484750 RepID=A0A4V2DCY3_9SPHN|nr:ferredoxin FdxA [Sphingomonas populi]RZF63088.1 ferredoxin family protein [Sphingomonas populi]